MNESEILSEKTSFSILEFFKQLDSTGDFISHGNCYLWLPEILWLNVISDAMIVIAYYSIPMTLLYFVIKRKKAPFHWIFLMFGLFIFLCGTSHLINIWTIWNPTYRLEGVVKLITGIVSLITAMMLIPIMPRAVSIPGLEALVDKLSKKNKDLIRANKELERFNRVTMGREHRILELKEEINKLCEELDRKKPYDLDES